MRSAHAVVAGLTMFALTMASACDRGGGGSRSAGPPGARPLVSDTLCADPTKWNQLCPVIPHELVIRLPGDYHGLSPQTQTPFDVFSWESFVALNWPADNAGNPLPGSFTDNPTAPRVWEAWADAATVFWGDSASGPCGLTALHDGSRKVLFQMAKNGHVVDPHASFDEAVGGPLLDVNLNFALFEKKMSPDEEQYVRDSSLVTVQGQEAIDTVKFPPGFYLRDTLHTGGRVGSIEVKAAWRILQPGSGDDTTRYYHRQALIHVPAANSPNHIPFCIRATVGLVGMHIIHKTKAFPAWIWTTFEHEDNAPTCPRAAAGCGQNTGIRYSFFNPGCATGTCPVNTPLRDTTFLKDSSFIWNRTPPYGSRYAYGGRYGSQIVRTQALYAPTDSVNVFWRKQMGNSVWSHYRLIGSQWQAIVPGVKADTSNAPPILGNSALESFIPDSSSCIGCHTFARTAGTPKKFADFSFLLGMAGERPSMMAPFFIERGPAPPAAPAPSKANPAPATPPPPAGGQPRRR